MKPRTLLLAPLLLSCASNPIRPNTPSMQGASRAGASCAELLSQYVDATTFKLIYDPVSGRWNRASSQSNTSVVGANPVEGQRVVVCVEQEDLRARYEVTIGNTNRENATTEPRRSGNVGTNESVRRSEVTSTRPSSVLLASGPATAASCAEFNALRDRFCRNLALLRPNNCSLRCPVVACPPSENDRSIRQRGGAAADNADVAATHDADAADAGGICQPDPGASESNVNTYITLVHQGNEAFRQAATDTNPGTLGQLRAFVLDQEWEVYAGSLLRASEALEQERTQVMQALMDEFQRPVSERSVLRLRSLLAHLLLEEAPPRPAPCAAGECVSSLPFVSPTLNPVRWQSFSYHVNHEFLPRHIWLNDGRVFVRAAHEGAPVDGGAAVSTTELPPGTNEALQVFQESVRRTWNLVSFANDVLSELRPPRRVWDFGAFSADRAITIEVLRREKRLRLDDGTLELTERVSTSTRLEEVHGLTRFRFEPGVVVSTTQNPTFRLERNALGDQVIGQGFGVDTQVFPAVFVHMNFCELDLRVAPLYRVCGTGEVLGNPQFLGLLRNLGLSLGITPTPSVFQNVFAGLNLQVVPYLTLGGGLHFSAQRRLPPGFEAGDAFRGDQAALDAIVRTDFAVGGYFTLTLGQDIWTGLRGFRLQ